jgi:hypothetical protein
MTLALRFVLLHAGIGFAVATLLLAGVLATDPGGLATLLRRAEGHPWPLLLLWFFAGLSFSAVQLAIGVFQQGRED